VPTRFQSIDQWREFASAFESCKLPRVEWTHQAHLIVGLWFVAHHDADEALTRLRDRIRRYNEATGTINSDSSGYHETLTRLYLVGICDFIDQPSPPSVKSLEALLKSPISDKTWPLQFYSRSRLMSDEARLKWVPPDLAELPSDCFR